jgi:lipopolysaccharide transport system ATP-binding protein
VTTAILARDLGKDYEIYDRPADRLAELVTRRLRHRTFLALDGVSFGIEPGESVGLIGRNGAGKSTLLRLVAGVARPSRGRLDVAGSVASILELGTGFHPEFSGKDNAALNAAILGFSPREIAASLPRIYEFSELGAFLDRPVRTYSSGMTMRLAFSVAVSVNPEILIIDEALAVGDGAFQKKCVDRIRELQQSGRTIVFCSHALYMVTTLCARAMWLDEGRLVVDGPAVDVVHAYETHLMERSRRETVAEEAGTSSEVGFSGLEIVDDAGREVTDLRSGSPLVVRARVDTSRATRPARLGITVVRAADETRCCTVSSGERSIAPGSDDRGIAVRFESLPLTRGDYGIILTAESEEGAPMGRLDVRPAFRVRGDRFEVGVVRLDHEWKAGLCP